MDFNNVKLPLTLEEQEQILEILKGFQIKEKKYQRTIKYLEHDREYINIMFENEVRLRDFNEKEKEKQYLYNKLLLDACPSFIIVLNKDLRYVVGTSRLLCDYFGFSDALELNNLLLRNIFSKYENCSWVEHIEQGCKNVITTRESINFNDHINIFENRKMYVDISISPIIDNDNELQGVLFLMHDVTELLLTRNQAEAASRAKSYFLTNISHEIRTPMNAIRGMSNLLNTTTLNDLQRDYVKNMLTASDSLLQLINDILDFSKLDAKTLSLSPDKYTVEELINDVTNVIGFRATEKGLDFLLDIDPNIPSELYGDAIRIKQMLVNLLSNAVKYTATGYIKLSMTFERGDKQNIILLCEIEDSGIGIKTEDTDKLFVAFSKIDPVENYEQGLGLGLTITKNLALTMNGFISVKSDYGKGSTFSIQIPQKVLNNDHLAKIDQPDKKRVLIIGNNLLSSSLDKILSDLFVNYDHSKNAASFSENINKNSYSHIIYWNDMAEDMIKNNIGRISNVNLLAIKNRAIISANNTDINAEILFEPLLVTDIARFLNTSKTQDDSGQLSEESIGYFKTKNARVLLVDDNEINLIVAEELLKHYDIKVDAALSGKEAISLSKEHSYDLIFMDHMMPEMDGIETTANIRSLSDYYSKVPIIALTANAVVGVKEFFISNKLDDYLSKPIEIKDLNEILLKWLPEEKLEHIKTSQPETVEAKKNPLIENSELLQALQNKCNLDVESSLSLLAGNQDAYISLLEIFVNKSHQYLEQMISSYKDENWNDFRIFVHGCKSSFYNIGAKALSEEARKMELAALQSNFDYIKSNFSYFILDLEKIAEKLRVILLENKNTLKRKKASPEDFASLSKRLDEIDELINMLENQEASDIIEYVVQFTYNENIDQILYQIKNAINSFDYDNINRYIEEVKKQL